MIDVDAAFAEQFFDEEREVVRRNPGATQSRVDLGGGQVHRLHGFQRIDVRLELFVAQHGGLGGGEFRAHVAGEVFILGFPAVSLGVEEDGSLQFGDHIGNPPLEQGCDVLQINPASFAQ